jgi:hypothetical protein
MNAAVSSRFSFVPARFQKSPTNLLRLAQLPRYAYVRDEEAVTLDVGIARFLE